MEVSNIGPRTFHPGIVWFIYLALSLPSSTFPIHLLTSPPSHTYYWTHFHSKPLQVVLSQRLSLSQWLGVSVAKTVDKDAVQTANALSAK
jgi:hypothetical protein